jgi:hypothetical protein
VGFKKKMVKNIKAELEFKNLGHAKIIKKDNRTKGQMTIFIIIAIILVVALVLFFALRSKKIVDIVRPSMPSPPEYIEKCARDSAKEAIDIMLPQAGYIQPTNFKLYEDNKVGYLCYNNNFYYPCINQEPLYIRHLEQEIKSYIEPKIKDCFYNLKREYQNRDYRVEEGPFNLDIQLAPKQVDIKIKKRFEVSKEETRKYENFRVKLNSPLYDLAVVAQEIVSQEAKFCNFEYVGYSLLYPKFSIEKNQVGSGLEASDIYIIKDKVTGKQLFIAIRGCAMPGGL